MTPAEHVNRAEQYLDMSLTADAKGQHDRAAVFAALGLAHAQIAQAVEGGVPHGAVRPETS